MSYIKVQLDTKKYETKPENFGAVKIGVQSSKPQKISIEDMTKAIENGIAISPGVLMGGLSAINWTEQQLFMVDIDNQDLNLPILTLSDALKICKNNAVHPAFYYHTYSHTEKQPRFRLAFISEHVITNENERKAVMKTLINLFPQCDKACRNADRVFLGTNKKAVVIDLNARINPNEIIKLYTPPQQTPNTKKANKEIGEGERNSELFKIAVKEVENGFDEDEVLQIISLHNQKRCDTPLDDKEISQIICNAFQYANPLTYEQKRNFAIKQSIKVDTELLEKLIALNPLNYPQDDIGLSLLFSTLYKDTFRYNNTAKEWFIYNGKIWCVDTGGMIVKHHAKEFTKTLLTFALTIDDSDKQKKYIDFANKLNKVNARENLLRDSQECYHISKEVLDSNTDLFNCQNGTLNLKTFELKPHNPNDLLSKVSNVYYDPNVKSLEFEKYINSVMQGNCEKIEYLQKILGYSLTADTRLETCFILYGATTRNGKSTLVETFAYMLGNTGGYAMTMKPETLATKQNTDSRQANGDIARLDGCRFLNAAEPPKRMIFDTGLLKNLLGRDSITARHLHEREFEFTPIFKLFMNTNFLPLITDDTLFSSGRINVITFDKHFTEAEQDKNLKNRLKKQENISGFFNWCFEGLHKFIKEGAEPPDCVKNATSEYRATSDKIGNFIKECLEKSAGHNMKGEICYTAYKNWCLINGFGVENKTNFFSDLKTKGFLSDGRVNGISIRNIIKGYKLIQNEQKNEML